MDPFEVDPWDWTIDQVVDELCYKRAVWKSRSTAPLPDPAVFEQVLRENEIDGAALLSTRESELKEEFNIKPLGQRKGLAWGIKQLQKLSSKYAENAHPSEQSVLTNAFLSAFSHQGSEVPRLPYSPSLATIQDTPIQQFLNRDEATEAGAASPFARPLLPVQEQPNERDLVLRPGEVIVEAGGKRQRRLELTAPVPQADTIPSAAAAAASVNPASPTPEALVEAKGPKLQIDIRAELCGIKAGTSITNSFFGKKALSVDAIFFENRGIGRRINSNIDTPLLDDDAAGKEEVFVASNQHIRGRQEVVNRKMMYFFQQAQEFYTHDKPETPDTGSHSQDDKSPDSDSENDKVPDFIGIYPYSSNSVTAAESRSLILAQEIKGMITTTRETGASLKRLLTANPLVSTNEIDPDPLMQETEHNPSNLGYEYLAHWQNEPDADKELPPYEESGDEYDYEELEALARDMEKDAATVPTRKGWLDLLRVSEIIDQQITFIISEWERLSLPVFEQRKASAVWHKEKTAKGKLHLIAKARQRIEQLNTRLNILRGKLEGTIWHSEKELRSVCGTLEAYVEDIEKEKWEISVLKRPHAPFHPDKLIHTRKRREIKLNAESDDECVDSDEEIVDERQRISDFIDIDKLEEMDLTAADHDSPIEDDIHPDAATAIQDEARRFEEDDALGDDHNEHANEDYIKLEPLSTQGAARSEPVNAAHQIIDLTLSDSDANQTPVEKMPKPKKSSLGVSNNPTKDADADILRWDLDELVENNDRLKLMIKLIRSMPVEPYRRLRGFVTGDIGVARNSKISELIKDMHSVLLKKLGQDPDFSIIKQSVDRLTELLHLYLCWLEPSYDHFPAHAESHSKLQLPDLDRSVLQDAAERIEEDGAVDLRKCLQKIYRIFEQSEQPVFTVDLEVEDEEIVDVGNSIATPNKKRKRPVAESQFALDKRDNLKRTRLEYDNRQKLFLKSNENQSSGLGAVDNPDHVVNTGKAPDEPAIYVDAHIAKFIRSHQMEGVRFMWREIVGTSRNEETDGCLLAHTMGLGKTMQVITLLLTLSQAIKSHDPKVQSQIPKRLHAMRTLIICPPGLVLNWQEEINNWCPNTSKLGNIRVITAEDKVDKRLKKLREWHHESGILLMGYAFFRSWILNKATRFTEDEHAEIRKLLLESPTLVVADEAHTLKNEKSEITQVANQFTTKSRIALTGSPLSNHLLEYYTMVDWIAPGYLGELVEFKANYVEPIEEGLYKDSTSTERRKSLMQSEALKNMLEFKIHRKEVTVLKDSLKPKVEFVLKLPLTRIQTEAYKAFVDTAKSGKYEQTNNANHWAWIRYLTILCNHPTIYFEKVKADKAEEQKKEKKKEKEGSRSPVKRIPLGQIFNDAVVEEDLLEDDVSEPRDDGDDPDSQALANKAASSVLKDLADLFAPVTASPYAPQFSVKIDLLLQILHLSIDANDKVLVFSQSIPTLDFLGQVLNQANIKHTRLDGKTKMQARQDMTKDFNTSGKYDVFLISTKAGSIGFNLHGANRVVLFDFSFNPTYEEQAIGRVFRLGQTKPVFVYRFISAGTFEEELFNKAIYKMQLAYRVVEKKNLKSMAEKKTTALSAPKESRPENLAGHDGEGLDAAVLDHIVKNMTEGAELIHSISTTETLRADAEDFLTEAELKEVAQTVAGERLRKTDPVKWRAAQLARSVASSIPALPNGVPHMSNRSVPTVPTGATSANATAHARVPSAAHAKGPPPSPNTPKVRYPSLPNIARIPVGFGHNGTPRVAFQQNGFLQQSASSQLNGSPFQQNGFLQNTSLQQNGSPLQNGSPNREVVSISDDEDEEEEIVDPQPLTTPATQNGHSKVGFMTRIFRAHEGK